MSLNIEEEIDICALTADVEHLKSGVAPHMHVDLFSAET